MNQILGALLSLAVIALAFAEGLPLLVDLQMRPAQNDAGNQLAQMQAAGASYIRNHAASLVATIPVGGNVQVIPGSPLIPGSLIADGDLPSSFNDSNVFGQQHVLSIAQTSAGVLDGMVYTYGGDTILDKIAIRVAEAGPPNSTVVLSTDATNFEGAAGGESEAISIYQNATYPITAGHIGAHIVATSYAAQSPFLNRYSTGNTDDNTMHTAEYMNGNALNMGTSSTATTGGGDVNMAGGNVVGASQVAASQMIKTPKLADWNDQSYQVSPAGASNINSLTIQGTATATTYLHLSDARLKENIRRIDNPLAIVEQLEGHKFDWKQNGKPDIGFVAQEVQQVLPEAVVASPDGHLAVKYDVLTAPLVEAVKAQAEQIDQLNQALSQKSAEIDQLKGAVGQLEQSGR